jgi:GH15 family glucan-1,4-alpha-glucosidase
MSSPTLDLGVIGNGSFGALVDKQARVVWSCLPAFDGDPAFCALLSPRDHEGGDFSIELEDFADSEQHYLANTAILRTVLRDAHGGAVEVIDFAPRWRNHGRFYRPVSIIRQVRPLSGNPRIRVLARPLADWGARKPESTWGSNHVRWLLPEFTLRLTTDVPVRFIRDELPFVLSHPVNLMLGVDESLTRSLTGYIQEAQERTEEYWREWVRYLSVPLDWQDAVIRSAITLKLCQYEDSGAPWSSSSATSSTSPPPTAACSRCTASASRRHWKNTKCRRWPATAAWGRCGAATWPGSRNSTTCTAAWCWRPRNCSSTCA